MARNSGNRPKTARSAGVNAFSVRNAEGRDRTADPRTSGQNEFTHVKRVVSAQVQSEKLVSDRRDRIIRAAIVVFHREGFHSTTTAHIAREAGLTQSNLYNYVRSKQDVLFLVCEHLVSTYETLLDEVRRTHEDPYIRIVESLRAVTEVMSGYRDEVQLLYNETHALEKSDRVVILSAISRFIGRFEALVEDYERAKGPILLRDRRLAANFLSFIPAMIALRYWDLVLHNSERAQESIVGFILRGIGIPPADGGYERSCRS